MTPCGSLLSHVATPLLGEIALVLQPPASEQAEPGEAEVPRDSRLAEIEALACGCRSSDPEAWNALFPLAWPVLVTFVHRLYRSFDLEDAEDVAQASLEAAIRAIGSYSGRGLFRAWLFGIAAKQAATFHRGQSAQKRGHDRRVTLDLTCDARDPAAKTPVEISAERDRAALLHRAIEMLGERDRELVHLHFFGELTFEQIGSALRMNPKSVCTRLTRCKRELLVLLKRSDLTSCDG